MQLTALVDREEALAFLGHAGQELGPEMAERLQSAARLCEREMAPRGVWRVLPTADALAFLPGEDIARHVEGCPRVALMAVTLGAQSEQVLRRERAVSPTDGLLADACASSLAEQAANALNKLIAEEAAAEGWSVTSRYSPGYGDLPLSCQPAFLAACGADRALGIRATPANLLIPTKSITAAIGLKPACAVEEVRGGDDGAADSRCETCPVADTCALRARGRTCHGNPA